MNLGTRVSKVKFLGKENKREKPREILEEKNKRNCLETLAAANPSSAAPPPNSSQLVRKPSRNPRVELPCPSRAAASSRELRSRAAQQAVAFVDRKPPRLASRNSSASRRRAPLKPAVEAAVLAGLPRAPRSQSSSRAGSYFSSRADPPALEPPVCSGSFSPTLERLGPSDLGVLELFCWDSSISTSTVGKSPQDLRRLGKRVVTIRTRRANLQVLPRDIEDQIFVLTGAHVARVRERARDWVEAEVGAKASWRATRSDRGEP
ncbi:hypothetical protein E6C27_scaffold348G00410 [Cucumis melo var. makuwa]|uniref:Uncharacterized protein n=1 Tax=Cucumis melo var. makuwa TaxID=1194695 RepID=A0A5A7V5M8_CUCMM|nr:hypothetical protein E6C27_scaffold348G00410 [Cucumis melo var. makuwa]